MDGEMPTPAAAGYPRNAGSAETWRNFDTLGCQTKLPGHPRNASYADTLPTPGNAIETTTTESEDQDSMANGMRRSH